MSLADEGFRFTCRPTPAGDVYDWRHSLEMREGDIDCTDMSETEFDAFVAKRAQGDAA